MLMSISFSACGDNDDDNINSGGESSSSTNKYLIKQILGNEVGDTALVWTFIYNSDNKISSISEVSYFDNMSVDSHSYTYGDNSIIVDNETYNISNGRIISTSNGVIFTYDSDGYLTSASQNGNTITYTWSGGNMINMSYKSSSSTEESESITYEYSNFAFPLNYPYCPEVRDISHDEMMGFPSLLNYWGKTPKNLPKKYVYKKHSSVEETITYDFTMEDGYPIIIKVTDSHGEITVIKNQWK